MLFFEILYIFVTSYMFIHITYMTKQLYNYKHGKYLQRKALY